jgi:hypothetical protein
MTLQVKSAAAALALSCLLAGQALAGPQVTSSSLRGVPRPTPARHICALGYIGPLRALDPDRSHAYMCTVSHNGPASLRRICDPNMVAWPAAPGADYACEPPNSPNGGDPVVPPHAPR